MTSRDKVVEFLDLFKGCLMLDMWQVRDRQKNRQGLIELRITPARRKEVLLALTPEDYHAGPKPDDTDDNLEVWEFGTDVDGTEVYIKLRVVEDPGRRGQPRGYRALVWSFHPAEHRMRYPLKGER